MSNNNCNNQNYCGNLNYVKVQNDINNTTCCDSNIVTCTTSASINNTNINNSEVTILNQENKQLKDQIESLNNEVCCKLEIISDLTLMIVDLYIVNNLGDNQKALCDIGLRIADTITKYTKIK